MSRKTTHDVLKNAFEATGLNGHLATYSLRKSFAQRKPHYRIGDIFAVQEMFGHPSVAWKKVRAFQFSGKIARSRIGLG